MNRSSRLDVVVDLAKRKEEKAAGLLESHRKVLEQEKIRLQDLERYYQEYAARFKQKTVNVRADQLASDRDFLRQLSESKKIQQLQIDRAQGQFELAKQEWHRCHLKHDNLKAYVEKMEQEEMEAMEKREQKLVDEWVTLAHARR